MEIGTVSVLRIASPKSITAPPACPRLVIAHVLKDVVVQRKGLIDFPLLALCCCMRNTGNAPACWHQTVRLKIARHRVEIERWVLVIPLQAAVVPFGISLSRNSINDLELALYGVGWLHRQIEHTISKNRLASNTVGNGRGDFKDSHVLVQVRRGHRNPDVHLPGLWRNVFQSDVVSKIKSARAPCVLSVSARQIPEAHAP